MRDPANGGDECGALNPCLPAGRTLPTFRFGHHHLKLTFIKPNPKITKIRRSANSGAGFLIR